MTQPARTLTDADVEAIAERLAARLADLAKARPANAPAKGFV